MPTHKRNALNHSTPRRTPSGKPSPTAWGGRAMPPGWDKLRLVILRRDLYRCQLAFPDICLGRASTVDHIVAWARGGSDDPSNLTSACKPCHQRKTGQETGFGGMAKRLREPEQHPGLRPQPAAVALPDEDEDEDEGDYGDEW